MRKTKIVATIGPATNKPETLKALIEAGANVLRINLSHNGKHLKQTVDQIREIAHTLNQPLAIMADLQGPKIRIGCFKKGAITLKNGQPFTLYCSKNPPLGDESGVGVDYDKLCQDLKIGDRLLLDDGLIELFVKEIQSAHVVCEVVEGGKLSDHKGINRKGGGLSAGALTDKDITDMATAIKSGVDYIALSFVRNAEDIQSARNLLVKLKAHQTPIIAKVERTEALENLSKIIMASDGIMVARGDLAVEVGAAEVPGIQKQIINEARRLNKISITATQMMESMITHPQPTRAEVSDVANAVLDGTDAVMLSAETASGQFPIQVVRVVDKVCRSAEKNAFVSYEPKDDACHYRRSDQAIAMAGTHVANHFPIDAMVALTESGASAIWMSRQSSSVPIFAVSDNYETVRKLCLVKNVFPLYYDYRKVSPAQINQTIVHYLKQQGMVKPESYLLMTRGSIIGKPGGTNALEIIRT